MINFEKRILEMKTLLSFEKKDVNKLNRLFEKFGNPVVIEQLLFELIDHAICHENGEEWGRLNISRKLFLTLRINEHIRESYRLVACMKEVCIWPETMQLQTNINQARDLNLIFSDFDNLKTIKDSLWEIFNTGLPTEKDENYEGEKSKLDGLINELIFHFKRTYKIKNRIFERYEKLQKEYTEGKKYIRNLSESAISDIK